MMAAFTGYLHELTGKVDKIISAQEAEVSFMWNKTNIIGILNKSSFYVDCALIHNAKFITDYIHVGSKVKFICTNPGSCSSGTPATIVKAWRFEPNDVGFPLVGFSIALRPGLLNAYVMVCEVSKKEAVLSFRNEEGKKELVLMSANKLYLGRKPVNSCLTQVMHKNDNFTCDAVPVISTTNEHGCMWLATCVWRGNKPPIGYDDKPRKPLKGAAVDVVKEINELTQNPNNLFLFGEGQIMQLLNHENGLIVGEVKPKVFQTILFNRSVCNMGCTNFADVDLNAVFEERDRIRFIAVKAPSHLVVQWIATYVGPLDAAENPSFALHGMKVYTYGGMNEDHQFF